MSEGIMGKRWFKWTLAVVIIVAVLVLAAVVWHLWGKPDVNSESRLKAEELYNMAVAEGLNVPPVDTLERIYGTDGGYGIEIADSSLREASLLYTNAGTGEIVKRPSIAEARLIEFQLMVLKVYRPALYWDKVLPYIKTLKFRDESKVPEWLRKDLAQV